MGDQVPVIFAMGRVKFKVHGREPGHKGRPHVHVEFAGMKMVVDLQSLEVLSNDFGKAAMVAILREIENNQALLLEKWKEYHG